MQDLQSLAMSIVRQQFPLNNSDVKIIGKDIVIEKTSYTGMDLTDRLCNCDANLEKAIPNNNFIVSLGYESIPEEWIPTVSNTILIAYRDRIEQLAACLDSINDLPQGTDIVLLNAGSKQNIDDLLLRHRSLGITNVLIPYTGVFWKAKMLNNGIKNCMTDYVTVIDVDSVFPKKFWHRVSQQLAEENVRRFSYRVKQYAGMYSYETLDGKLTGNSHFTAKMEDIIAAGFYNEQFIGWGNEDCEFSQRLWKVCGDTTMFPEDIVHQHHGYEGNWKVNEHVTANSRLYEELKSKDFPKPEGPIGDFSGHIDENCKRFCDNEVKRWKRIKQMNPDIYKWNGTRMEDINVIMRV